MPGTIDERLDALREAIEALRKELQETIEESGGRLDNEKAYEVSNRLDKLIIQFLRIKERIQGEGMDPLTNA